MQSCGKTTVGAGVKFMYMVSASPKRLHIIAAKTTGIAEKNIIQQENEILDLHRNAVYCGNGDRNNKLPHIKFEGKLIYVLGYDNKDKWENVLGSQFGCVYIDEINTADIDFVREISTRNDYLLATLNPDDPSLPVYQEFVNRSRPCARYAADVPEEILRELTEEPVPGWRYWFFSFRDNLSLTEADIQRKMDAAPKGTKLYKNKILGLRGRATGLVFDLQQRHIITAAQAAEHRFLYYSIGCDTSYSRQSHDRLTFEAVGITADKKCIMLLEETHNNRDKTNPFAPSDVIPLLNRFAEQVKSRYGFARTIYIDSADAGTIQEAPKPKAAKAKAHTEGVSAGHAVEVTPPATKDNVGYSPEKIGGKSLTSWGDGGIIKMGKAKKQAIAQAPADFSKYTISEDIESVQVAKNSLISSFGLEEKNVSLDGICNAEVLKPFADQLIRIHEQTGFKLPNVHAVEMIDGDPCCIAGYKPMENCFYISSRYFNSKEALLDTLKSWASSGILPKQGKSIRYLAEHESAHMRIPDKLLQSEEAQEIQKTFLHSKSYNDNDAKIEEFFADAIAIYRMNPLTTDTCIVMAVEYLKKAGIT